MLWSSKSLQKLCAAPLGMGHEVSERTLGRLLKAQGYRLQADEKVQDHDFPDPEVPKAVRYGVHDIAGLSTF